MAATADVSGVVQREELGSQSAQNVMEFPRFQHHDQVVGRCNAKGQPDLRPCR